MYGAFGLKPGTLNGEILLNLDSEDEGELYIGCAGGMDVTATLEYKEVAPEAGYRSESYFERITRRTFGIGNQ